MRRIFLFALICVLCVGLFACKKPQPQKEAEQPKESFSKLQDEFAKPVQKYENDFVNEGKTPEGEASAKNKPEELAVSEPGKEPGATEPAEGKEQAAPSGIDPETKLPYENLIAEIQTSKGTFKIKFWHDTAPKHVENFMKLVRKGFYDGLIFHRYEAGFVIQGGDPQGTGQGGPGYTIPAEISDKHMHVKGAVAAARTGDQVNPKRESSGSQFYVVLDAASGAHLDGAYTVWGQVVSGMDVVMQLRKGDKIRKITIREKQ